MKPFLCNLHVFIGDIGTVATVINCRLYLYLRATCYWAAGRTRIKYTPISKRTYDTDNRGIEFQLEINGQKAKGTWTPYFQYNPRGVDINELRIEDGTTWGKRLPIFDGGGGHRTYEIASGELKPNPKQPKDLRWTGKYYDTAQLKDVFVKKIEAALAGQNATPLHKDFLAYFKLEPVN